LSIAPPQQAVVQHTNWWEGIGIAR